MLNNFFTTWILIIIKLVYQILGSLKHECRRSADPMEDLHQKQMKKSRIWFGPIVNWKFARSSEIDISNGSVDPILKDYLGKRNLFGNWVPRLLKIDSKCNRASTSKECLVLFDKKLDEFLSRFIIVEETWTYQNTLDTEQQQKQ